MQRSEQRVSIGDAATISIAASATLILLGIVQSKVSAVFLGPTGVGQLSEIRQIVTLLLVPVGAFAGPALIARIAEAHGRGDAAAGQRVYDVAATCIAILGVVLSLLSIAIGWVVLDTGVAHPAQGAFLAAVAALGTVCVSLTSQSLIACGELRAGLSISVLSSTAAAAALSVGTAVFGLTGQLAALAIVPWLLLPLGARIAGKRLPSLRVRPALVWDPRTAVRLATIGIGTIIGALALQGTLSVTRWVLHQEGGAAANGQFHAAWTVGVGYITIVLSSLGSFVFPRYAAAASPSALQAEVDEAARFVLRIAPPVILIAIGGRDLAMRLLFTNDFALGAEILGFQMAGDLAKAIAYVYAGPLLYRGHVRAFLVTELLAAALLIALTTALVPRFGPAGAGYAYAIAYPVYSLAAGYVLSRAAGAHARTSHQLAVLGFCALAAALAVATRHVPGAAAGTVAVGIVWSYFAGLHRAIGRRLRDKLARVRVTSQQG